MLVIVVTEVLESLILRMRAIVSRCSPGYLEREQAQHEQQEEASHSERVYSIYSGLAT